MLFPLVVTLLLCAFGAVVVARAFRSILQALGTDVMPVLLWLGIAEEPLEQRRRDRGRLRELKPV